MAAGSEAAAAPVQFWIDATRPASGWSLWGMSLAERQVREAALRQCSSVHLWVSEESEGTVRHLRRDLAKVFRGEVAFHQASIAAGLSSASGSVVLLEGDVVYDQRVLDHLLELGPGHGIRDAEGTAAVFLGPEQARSLGASWSAGPLAHKIAQLGLELLDLEQLDHYVPSLRLTMQPFMRRLRHRAQLPELERLMYRRSFKGVIDAVALYGYYHLVRWITRHLSRTSLTPNLFTALSIVGIWGAIPCFATGHHGLGILAAWVGVILDSVDGKLARLRLHLSDAMGDFEHLAAMPGLGLWYLSLGYYLSDRQLFSGAPMAIATWILVASYLTDKALSGGFRALYKQKFFDYRPIDAAFHLIACRRNISLLIYSLGLLLNVPREAFYGMAAWMVVAMVFHGVRFASIAATDGAGLRRELGHGP